MNGGNPSEKQLLIEPAISCETYMQVGTGQGKHNKHPEFLFNLYMIDLVNLSLT